MACGNLKYSEFEEYILAIWTLDNSSERRKIHIYSIPYVYKSALFKIPLKEIFMYIKLSCVITPSSCI